MESLLTAETSSDLGEGQDVDFLRAAGMVGQTYPTALAVWRLTELHDKRAAREAFDGLVTQLIKMRVTHNPVHVAAAVLEWMMDPVCPACHGRAYDQIPGTPALGAIECNECLGEGKRAPQWGPDAAELYAWLRGQQRLARRAIAAKLTTQDPC